MSKKGSCPDRLVFIPGLPCKARVVEKNEYGRAVVEWIQDGERREGEIDFAELEAYNSVGVAQ